MKRIVILNFIKIIPLTAILFSCGPAMHESVEKMSATDRASFIKSYTSDRLCEAYFRPWAQPLTKSEIRKVLTERKYSECPQVVKIDNTNSTAKAMPTAQRKEPKIRSESRIYRKGRRGGCYYIASSGNRVYVDRSICR